jgi:hypothetical protein
MFVPPGTLNEESVCVNSVSRSIVGVFVVQHFEVEYDIVNWNGILAGIVLRRTRQKRLQRKKRFLKSETIII